MSEAAVSNSLFISVFEDPNASSYYHLSLNTRNLLKFYTSEQSITYLPTTFQYRLVQPKDGIDETVIGAQLTITITGTDRATDTSYEKVIETTQQLIESDKKDPETGLPILIVPKDPYKYTFPAPTANNDKPVQTIDIDKITIRAMLHEKQVAYEELTLMYGTTSQMAKLSLKANGIYAAVADAGFTFDDSGLLVTNGSIAIQNKNGHQVFRADTEGNLYFEGQINSQSGFLSGWILKDNELIDNSGKVGIHSGDTRFYMEDDSPVRFWAGAPLSSTATASESSKLKYNFAVTEEGTLYANDAKVHGSIEATDGRILDSFYVGPDNENGIIIHGEKDNSYIGSMLYSSGALGSGWKINYDGSAEFNNVNIRGKIQSAVFEYNKISSVGGSLYVAPTIYLEKTSSSVIYSNNNYVTKWAQVGFIPNATAGGAWRHKDKIKLNGTFIKFQRDEENNELPIILLKYDASDISGEIIIPAVAQAENDYSDPQKLAQAIDLILSNEHDLEIHFDFSNKPELEWHWIYDDNQNQVAPKTLKGNVRYYNNRLWGAIRDNNSEPTITAVEDWTELSDSVLVPGASIIFYGNETRRNGLYLTAVDSGAPYLEIYDSKEDISYSPKVRLGNLAGITDSYITKGESLKGYGLYSSNAYLRGQLMLPSAGITNQDDIKVNGSPIRIWAGTSATEDITKSNFIVTEDGSLYAKQGTFEGVVKANNSEFSGSIRAAGILLESEDREDNDTLHDHFFITRVINQQVENLKVQIKTETEYSTFKGKTELEQKADIINCGFNEEQTQEILTAVKNNSTYEDFCNYLNDWTHQNFVPSYQNYILNIDESGLSIWEGGLQAYSDFANGENNPLADRSHLVAYAHEEGVGALPFLYLVDDGDINELTSRMVLNKLHIINFLPKANNTISYCEGISTQLNSGLWLADLSQIEYTDGEYKNFESSVFGLKDSGLTLENGNLIIKHQIANGAIALTSPNGVSISTDSVDTSQYLNNALIVSGGNIQVINKTKAELKMNSTIVQEAKSADGTATIGINFIAVS